MCPWLTRWQGSGCGAAIAEAARNLPCRVLGKVIYGEVSQKRHSTTNHLRGCQEKFLAVSHHKLKRPRAEEALYFAGAKHWRSRAQHKSLTETLQQETKPFPPAISLWCPLLTHLNICQLIKDLFKRVQIISQSRQKG